jgi:hypothetical protein
MHSSWNYAVLAFSAALDFYSWRISYLELRAHKRGENVWDEVIGSKVPPPFTHKPKPNDAETSTRNTVAAPRE